MDTADFKTAAARIAQGLRDVSAQERTSIEKFGAISDEIRMQTRRLLHEWQRLVAQASERQIDPQLLLPEADWSYVQSVIRAEAEVASARQVQNLALDYFVETGIDVSRLPRRKPRPTPTFPLSDWP